MTTSDAPAVTPGRPLGLKAAARITNVSLSTLRRRSADLIRHGATRNADGSWSIPIDTLVALDLLDSVTPGDTRTVRPGEHPSDGPVPPDALGTISDLRRLLAEAEQRAAVAEAIAAERDRIIEGHERTIAAEQSRAIEAEQRYVRALEAAAAPSAEIVPATRRRSPWWARLFGQE